MLFVINKVECSLPPNFYMISYFMSNFFIVWNTRIGINGHIVRCQELGVDSCAFAISFIGMFNDVNLQGKLQSKMKYTQSETQTLYGFQTA